MTQGLTYAVVGFWLALRVFPAVYPAQQPDLETDLKAAFLFNFTKYIEWQLPPSETEFTIAVVGPSDIDEALKEISGTKMVDNKRIVIRHFDKLDQITPCQVLFISRRSKIKLADILARAGKGVLTVGEEAGAARSGTIFDFIRVGDKLKFEVNTVALSASGLKISSQLLRLALIVN